MAEVYAASKKGAGGWIRVEKRGAKVVHMSSRLGFVGRIFKRNIHLLGT